MKKVLVLCMTFFCLGTVEGLHAGDLEVKSNFLELTTTAYMGSLGTVYVDVSRPSWQISVSAPSERVTGTSPATDFSVSGGTLTMTLERDVVNIFSPGQRANIGVGVQLPGGGTGVYEITLVGR